MNFSRPDITKNLDRFPLRVMPFRQKPMPCHRHVFHELVYVQRGRGIHIHSQSKYPLIAGDCFVIVPGTVHGYEDIHDMSIVNILFLPGILKPLKPRIDKLPGFSGIFGNQGFSLTNDNPPRKVHFDVAGQSEVNSLINGMLQEQRKKIAGHEIVIQSMFFNLVVMICRTASHSEGSRIKPSMKTTVRSPVETAIAFLEQNFAKPVSITDVASEVFLSPSRLAHVFREATGNTVSQYLTNIRLERSKQLLEQAGSRISDIAEETGFSDPGYFSRKFRRHFGFSPNDVRRDMGKVVPVKKS